MLTAMTLQEGLPPASLSLPHRSAATLETTGLLRERASEIGHTSLFSQMRKPTPRGCLTCPGPQLVTQYEPLAPGNQLHHSIHPLCPTCLTPVHGNNLIKK